MGDGSSVKGGSVANFEGRRREFHRSGDEAVREEHCSAGVWPLSPPSSTTMCPFLMALQEGKCVNTSFSLSTDRCTAGFTFPRPGCAFGSGFNADVHVERVCTDGSP